MFTPAAMLAPSVMLMPLACLLGGAVRVVLMIEMFVFAVLDMFLVVFNPLLMMLDVLLMVFNMLLVMLDMLLVFLDMFLMVFHVLLVLLDMLLMFLPVFLVFFHMLLVMLDVLFVFFLFVGAGTAQRPDLDESGGQQQQGSRRARDSDAFHVGSSAGGRLPDKALPPEPFGGTGLIIVGAIRGSIRRFERGKWPRRIKRGAPNGVVTPRSGILRPGGYLTMETASDTPGWRRLWR
jgi:hypothetical protein